MARAKIKPSAWIGVDPGVTGAIGWVTDADEIGVTDMPALAVKKSRRECQPHLLFGLLRDLNEQYNIIAYAVEKASARPGQGVSSVFSFGDSYGVARTAGAFFGWRVIRPTPQAWRKTVFQSRDTAAKDASRALVGELWPDYYHESFRRVKDHNRAEAVLIALHAKRSV